MRRWNGWGDDTISFPLPESAHRFLVKKIGEATPLPDAGLDEVLARVPQSRLPDHPLVTKSAEERMRHARGQSLPDWLALRSGNLGVFPDGVAYPANSEHVRNLLAYAKEAGAFIIPYGGGTSVVGHISPERGSSPVLTVDMGRMNRLMSLDKESQIATFGSGTAGPDVEAQLRAQGYTLGHFPQSFECSTLGGWVATRSSGQQSLRYGRIEHLFAGGQLETPVGNLEIPPFPASAAGPDLREIVLGSEGRLGVLTDVKVRVTPLAQRERFHVVLFPDWQTAVAAVRTAAQTGIPLSMLRLGNSTETETQLAFAGHERLVALFERLLSWRGIREEKCMLMFGVTGTRIQCRTALEQALRIFKRKKGVHAGTYMGRKWAQTRFLAPYLRNSLWEKGYAVDTLETATNWQGVDQMVAAIESALSGVPENGEERIHVFTHLSHLYPQGSSIYTSYIFRVGKTYEETLARWQRLKIAASEAIVASGGTISHQHGIGVDHAPYLAAEKGPLGIATIEALCRQFDPNGMMNPGKLVRSYPSVENRIR
jgi:alkyldihydroxyacetonephosphate synthase